MENELLNHEAASAPETASGAPEGDFSAAAEGGAPSPEALARARVLLSQADALKRATGTDLLAAFSTDASLRERVASGEWDFADAYRSMGAREAPPAPVRSGGGSVGGLDIASMSESQFARLDRLLAEGGVVEA